MQVTWSPMDHAKASTRPHQTSGFGSGAGASAPLRGAAAGGGAARRAAAWGGPAQPGVAGRPPARCPAAGTGGSRDTMAPSKRSAPRSKRAPLRAVGSWGASRPTVPERSERVPPLRSADSSPTCSERGVPARFGRGRRQGAKRRAGPQVRRQSGTGGLATAKRGLGRQAGGRAFQRPQPAAPRGFGCSVRTTRHALLVGGGYRRVRPRIKGSASRCRGSDAHITRS
jgi:hypothetical protein